MRRLLKSDLGMHYLLKTIRPNVWNLRSCLIFLNHADFALDFIIYSLVRECVKLSSFSLTILVLDLALNYVDKL